MARSETSCHWSRRRGLKYFVSSISTIISLIPLSLATKAESWQWHAAAPDWLYAKSQRRLEWHGIRTTSGTSVSPITWIYRTHIDDSVCFSFTEAILEAELQRDKWVCYLLYLSPTDPLTIYQFYHIKVNIPFYCTTVYWLRKVAWVGEQVELVS